MLQTGIGLRGSEGGGGGAQKCPVFKRIRVPSAAMDPPRTAGCVVPTECDTIAA